VPQPIQELPCRRPLGGGVLELSAEAHTPAYAIRRKIAIRAISNPGDSQTPDVEIISHSWDRPDQSSSGPAGPVGLVR
jgi:hypothetical protein